MIRRKFTENEDHQKNLLSFELAKCMIKIKNEKYPEDAKKYYDEMYDCLKKFRPRIFGGR